MNLLALQRNLQEFDLEIFTLNDVIKITEQTKTCIKSTLTRWVKQKKIFRVKKGYYSLQKIENKFQLQRVYNETYIGLHSALEYYGSTTQRFNNLDLITKNRLNEQKIENTRIQFHKVSSKLFFGYERATINKTKVFISSIEKTLIDCIYFSSKVYLTDINEFIRKNKKTINRETMIVYLKRINSSALNKRVGYLLEINNISLKGLNINNKYEKLNVNLNKKGTINTKWKLIINEKL